MRENQEVKGEKINLLKNIENETTVIKNKATKKCVTY